MEKESRIRFIYVIQFNDDLMFFTLADNFRPYLTSFQGNSYTDYINAVFVDVSLFHFFM